MTRHLTQYLYKTSSILKACLSLNQTNAWVLWPKPHKCVTLFSSLPWISFEKRKRNQCGFNLQLKFGCGIFFFLRKNFLSQRDRSHLLIYGQRGKYKAARQPAKYPSAPGTLVWMGMWKGLACFSQWAQGPVSGRRTEGEWPGTHLSASLQLQNYLWGENSQVSDSYYWQQLKTVISHWDKSPKNNVWMWKDGKS